MGSCRMSRTAPMSQVIVSSHIGFAKQFQWGRASLQRGIESECDEWHAGQESDANNDA